MLALERPLPPERLCERLRIPEAFAPAPKVAIWLRQAFIEDGPLHNPEHGHLKLADICVLWTNAANVQQGQPIAGTAEMPRVDGPQWAKAKARFWLNEWFGRVPEFLITLDALACVNATDTQFCALIEHELYHCAQARDAYGCPKFNRLTGRPIFTIRGHDVEEFVGVVRRYGPQGVLNPMVRELVEVAQHLPEVSRSRVSLACSCGARVA